MFQPITIPAKRTPQPPQEYKSPTNPPPMTTPVKISFEDDPQNAPEVSPTTYQNITNQQKGGLLGAYAYNQVKNQEKALVSKPPGVGVTSNWSKNELTKETALPKSDNTSSYKIPPGFQYNPLTSLRGVIQTESLGMGLAAIDSDVTHEERQKEIYYKGVAVQKLRDRSTKPKTQSADEVPSSYGMIALAVAAILLVGFYFYYTNKAQ